MEVESAHRMKGNSAEISILKSQYTDFFFMKVQSSTIVSSWRLCFGPLVSPTALYWITNKLRHAHRNSGMT